MVETPFNPATYGEPDVFAVASALYWHCADYHEGQWSERYSILSTLPYKPGACERGPEKGSDAEAIYLALAEGLETPSAVAAYVREALS